MKLTSLLLGICLVLGQPLRAAPFPLGTAFAYQGRLTDGGTPANGLYHFYFELFDAPVGGAFLGADEWEEVEVINGLFQVPLNFGLAAFSGSARWLAISVETNSGGGLTVLSPRQELLPAPNSLFSAIAGGVTNGAIDSAMIASGAVTSDALAQGAVQVNALADGAVTTPKLLDGSVTSAKLAPGTVVTNILATTNSLALGTASLDGRLDVYRTGTGTPAIQLLGGANQISTFGDDGLEQVRLWGPAYGELWLNNSLPGNQTAVFLSANSSSGGRLSLNNSNGQARAELSGANAGGLLHLYQSTGTRTLSLMASNSQIKLYTANGQERVILAGDGFGTLHLRNSLNPLLSQVFLAAAQGGGLLWLQQDDGNIGAILSGANAGGALSLNNSNGATRAVLTAANTGGSLQLNNSGGALSVDMRSQFSSGNTAAWVGLNDNGAERISFAARNGATGAGGLIGIRNGSGVATILLTGDDGTGEGRMVTQVLQITGGADLSEHFDVQCPGEPLQPGMVVSIDPENPGQLVRSRHAYDRTVAGVVSGAGGIKPGMLMAHHGTPADGKHPIALTGRVFCLVDAGNGAIRPGDSLTTSSTPGHAMKVTDYAKAQGAVLGKAMTALESGRGLVLILVSLQ